MRKKFVAGMLALVGLSGFVALGSSPKFVYDLLESVQNNSITGIFSPTTGTESANARSEHSNSTPERPLKNAVPSSGQLGSSVPDHVLYDTLFRMDNGFRTKALEQETTGQIPTAFKYYFKNEASLTNEQDLILEQVATEFIAEVEAIDEQAEKIIESDEKAEAKATALGNLQEQRDAVVLSNRDKLSNLLGPTVFGQFNEYVQGNFALHLNSHEAPTN